MHFDFRPLLRRTFAKLCKTFAELSRKYPYPQTTAISRGCIKGTANTRGLGVWLSQKCSLAAACGACFFRLQKATDSTRGRCKDVLPGPWYWLWRSLTFGSLVATYEGKGKCAVPFSCRPRAAGGGSPEQPVMYTVHNDNDS